MAGNPSTPTKVDVPALKKALVQLQQVQWHMKYPPPGGWDTVSMDLQSDLQQTDGTGLQGNGATVAGEHYVDSATWMKRAHDDIVSSVNTLVGLVTTTIGKHTAADNSAAESATNTNTSQSTGAAGMGK